MRSDATFVGPIFATFLELPDEPVWGPLEAVARISRTTPDLPSFHEGEFMFMATVRNLPKRLAIHLYKHIDTRRYLNLDDGAHAYAYRGTPRDRIGETSGAKYQRHRSLFDAICWLELWAFEDDPPLFRSFPPSEWPTEARRVG